MKSCRNWRVLVRDSFWFCRKVARHNLDLIDAHAHSSASSGIGDSVTATIQNIVATYTSRVWSSVSANALIQSDGT